MAIPETWQGLADAGYVFDNEGVCKGCGAKIDWFITPKGRKMPMSVIEVRKTQSGLSPVVGYKRVPHWTDCPNAKDFRRKR
jgi:hypothetical protein